MQQSPLGLSPLPPKQEGYLVLEMLLGHAEPGRLLPLPPRRLGC